MWMALRGTSRVLVMRRVVRRVAAAIAICAESMAVLIPGYCAFITTPVRSEAVRGTRGWVHAQAQAAQQIRGCRGGLFGLRRIENLKMNKIFLEGTSSS
jgi:hypothetical protein